MQGKIIWSESDWKDNLKDSIPNTSNRNTYMENHSDS